MLSLAIADEAQSPLAVRDTQRSSIVVSPSWTP